MVAARQVSSSLFVQAQYQCEQPPEDADEERVMLLIVSDVLKVVRRLPVNAISVSPKKKRKQKRKHESDEEEEEPDEQA